MGTSKDRFGYNKGVTALQKSLLISAGLHIFVFLGFWVTPKKQDVPMSFPRPITVDLVERPGTATGNVGSPQQSAKPSFSKPRSGPKKLTLSDLAPKWDLSVPKKGGEDSSNSPAEPEQNAGNRGGSAMDLLNRPELVYSSYYRRIHDKLDYHWQSKIKYEVLKKQAKGEWNYYLSRVTRTRVILDSQGHLKKVIVLSPSGEQELDASALTAFQEASPFPNPPRELIKNDEVSIDWDFILEIYD